jgi:hypothetical protein
MATLTNGDIFRSAAALIRKGGLWKGANGPYVGGAKCVWTAIYDSAPAERRHGLGVLVTERVLEPGAQVCDLYAWNDESGRTAEHVIAVLEGLAFDEDLKAATTAVDTTIPVAEQIAQLVEVPV